MKPYWTEMSSLKYLSPTPIMPVPKDPTLEQSSGVQVQHEAEAVADTVADTIFGRRHAGYEAHEILKLIVDWGDVRDIWKDQGKWKYIEHTLRINADLHATNAVDKVYSLYSVFRRIFENFPKPKYDRSGQLLWVFTSLSIIGSFRTFDIIASICNDGSCGLHGSVLSCTSQECVGSSPSRWCYIWEPELTKAHWQRPFTFFEQHLPRSTAWDRGPQVIFERQSMSIQQALGELDELAKHDDASKLFCIQDVRLSVQGKLAARITKTSSKPQFLSRWLSSRAREDKQHRDDGFLREMTAYLRQWIDMIRTVHPRAQDRRRIFYDLLMWERSPEVTSTSLEDFANWCLLLEKTDVREQRSDVDMKALRAVNERDYHVQLCGFEQFRRLFLTDDGRLGKASYALEVNDLVVLLCWSRMPAILRPVKDGDKVINDRKLGCDAAYLLVGFAYIDGLMDCKDWNLQEHDMEEFCLV
jgi:hypothetical protein